MSGRLGNATSARSRWPRFWLCPWHRRLLHCPRPLSSNLRLEEDADPEQRARQKALEAYHFHLLGQQNQAIGLVGTILTSSEGDNCPWPRAVAAYLATAVALGSGRADIAGAMLSVALASVHKTKDPNLMNMVGELRSALKVLSACPSA